MTDFSEPYYNVNTEVPDDAPGWKRLDTLIRRWSVKRQSDEALAQYEANRAEYENLKNMLGL